MRLAVVLGVLLGGPLASWAALSFGGEAARVVPTQKSLTIDGMVRPLGDILRDRGISTDEGRIEGWFVLVTGDGEGFPLLPNRASLALFTDERLRNRAIQVEARTIEGLPHLEVIVFQVRDESGALSVAEYDCDVCSISARFDQTCPCCQGPMVLRLKPVK